MRATIKMIAERAGVSIGTVDRVLHDRPYVKEEVRRRVLEVNDSMAGRALRVIAVASRKLERSPGENLEGAEEQLTFLGLFGLMDPPRPEARAAVARCHMAGVRPVMITGDHRATAAAVARALDLSRPGIKFSPGRSWSG